MGTLWLFQNGRRRFKRALTGISESEFSGDWLEIFRSTCASTALFLCMIAPIEQRNLVIIFPLRHCYPGPIPNVQPKEGTIQPWCAFEFSRPISFVAFFAPVVLRLPQYCYDCALMRSLQGEARCWTKGIDTWILRSRDYYNIGWEWVLLIIVNCSCKEYYHRRRIEGCSEGFCCCHWRWSTVLILLQLLEHNYASVTASFFTQGQTVPHHLNSCREYKHCSRVFGRWSPGWIYT